MNNLRTELDKLKDKRLDYVMERAKSETDIAAYKKAGISKTTFFAWGKEEREHLNEVAQMIKRETATRAIMVLQDAAEEAARVKVAGLKDRDARVKQAAATEILDRTIGKSMEKVDLTSGGEKINIKLVKDD